MNELPGFICTEKFIQIKGILFNIIIREFYTLPYLVADDIRHLVGEERQTRQILIWILFLP